MQAYDNKIIGRRRGLLTVTSFSHVSGGRARFYNCACACGNNIKLQASHIKLHRSCGCESTEDENSVCTLVLKGDSDTDTGEIGDIVIKYKKKQCRMCKATLPHYRYFTCRSCEITNGEVMDDGLFSGGFCDGIALHLSEPSVVDGSTNGATAEAYSISVPSPW